MALNQPATSLQFPKWKAFFLLYLASIASQLGYLFFQSINQHFPFSDVVLSSLIVVSIVTIPCILIGLTLGTRFGLSLINMPSNTASNRYPGLRFTLVSSVLLGLFLLAMRWLLVDALSPALPEYGFRGLAGGFLASLSAAVTEEILFRFGVMTLLLWLCSKAFGRACVNQRTVFLIIVITGIGFGLAHVPSLVAQGANDFTTVFATLGGNLAVSVLYGWCYWRYGLLMAMLAHFTLDIVLHCLPVFF